MQFRNYSEIEHIFISQLHFPPTCSSCEGRSKYFCMRYSGLESIWLCDPCLEKKVGWLRAACVRVELEQSQMAEKA